MSPAGLKHGPDPRRPYRIVGIFCGVLLGAAAPWGYLFLRLLFSGRVSWEWYVAEIGGHYFTYFYLFFPTTIIFTVFGFFFGKLADRVVSQKHILEKMNVVLENQSITDDLTGRYNHRHVLSEIDREVERSKRYGCLLSGMMIDIDDFKAVNDYYGHLTGDSVIREMAEVISQNVRNVDIIGRFGGDEFVVILPEADEAAARVVAERILENVRKRSFRTGRDYIKMTVSIGIFSLTNPKDFTRAEFLDKIDRAMFRSKNEGKNRIYSA